MEKATGRRMWWRYILPPLIAAVLLCIVYAVRGVFPFGEGSIAYFDCADQFIPQYFHLHDALHGKSDLFFSWNTALGVNMAGVVGRSAFLSPVNLLFFLLVPRDAILPAMSFFLMLKLALIALTAFVLLDRCFSRIPLFWKTALSLLYAYSGYVFQYYSNLHWLDTILLIPLILLGLHLLISREMPWLYLGTLTLCLVQDLYLSFMVYLFLLTVGGLYFLLVLPAEKRGKAAWTFGWTSVTALLLSAPMTLPAFLNIQNSSRFGWSGGYEEILKAGVGLDGAKNGMLVMTALLAVLLVLLLSTVENRRITLFFLSAAALLTLPIFFENIDLLWHGGSYMLFPMRFAFLLPLVLILAGAVFLQRNGEELPRRLAGWKPAAGAILCGLLCLLLLWKLSRGKPEFPFQPDWKYFWLYLLLALSYYLAMKIGYRRLSYGLIGVLLTAEALLYGMGSFAENIHPSSAGKESRYITVETALAKELELSGDRLSRIKDADAHLNSNYPLVMGVPALSNWTHLLDQKVQPAVDNLGYTTVYTRLGDAGGTAFTDALLRVTRTLSVHGLEGPLYQKAGEAQDMLLYDNLVQLPFGLVTDSQVTAIAAQGGKNSFVLQNQLYALLADDGPLLRTPDGEESGEKLTFTVSGRQYLYYRGASGTLWVNGEAVPVPSTGDSNNTHYPATFNNGILCLGYFENETVTVEAPSVYAGQFALLDADKLLALSAAYQEPDKQVEAQAGARQLSVQVSNAQEDEMLLLPLTNEKGWSCVVNGRRVEIMDALGCLMAIPLEAGENRVELRFTAPGLLPGLLVCGVTALAIAACWILARKMGWRMQPDGRVARAAEVLLLLAVTLALMIFYAVPILAAAASYFGFSI